MKDQFVKSAFVLMLAGVVAKIFSVVYRILLTRLLGGEGIGLYQLIFPVYSIGVVLTTTGIPMAISKVVAKNRDKCVIKKCFRFTFFVSVSLMVLLLICSKPLAIWQGKKELAVCYLLLGPSFLLLSSASVLRGYFQGMGNFKPSAIASVLEQFIKLSLGLGASLVLAKHGIIIAIYGAVGAILASEMASTFVLVLLYLKSKSSKKKEVDISALEIFKDVWPVVLTNLILPLASFVDSLIVVKLLGTNSTGRL